MIKKRETTEAIVEREKKFEGKGRNPGLLSIIIVISIIVSLFAGYYLSGVMQQSEISSLTSEYNSEKTILELQIETLQNQKDNLQDQIDALNDEWQDYEER